MPSIHTLVAAAATVLATAAPGQTTRNVPSPAYPTIQSALAASISGDTVLVAPGIYNEHDLEFAGNSIHLLGSAGAAATILDAQQAGPVIVFDDLEGPGAIVEGFSITNGLGGVGQAGGVVITGGASPTVLDCVIQNNTGTHGPALGAAGGLSIAYGGSATLVQGCRITNNTCTGAVATIGGGAGGVTIWAGAPVLRDCRIVGNTSNSIGLAATGGVLCNGGTTATIDSCLISLNHGGSDAVGTAEGGAGGITMLGGFPRIVNCMIARNTAGDANSWNRAAGGVYIGGSTPGTTPFVTNCTIVLNVGGAAGTGTIPPGGVYVDAATPVEISNSILWSNTEAGGAPAQLLELGGAVVSYCDVMGSHPGVGNLDADPVLVEDAAGYWRLQAGSPCVDVGSPAAPFVPAVDFEGDPRAVGGVDLGADEFPQPYPGTNEDFRLRTSLNAALPDGDAVELATAFDVLHVVLDSPGATFDFSPLLLAATPFSPGAPPFSGIPGIHLDLGMMIPIADGLFCSGFGCPRLLPGGTGYDLLVPPGLAGVSMMLQGVVLVQPGAIPANGLFAATDGHELRIQ